MKILEVRRKGSFGGFGRRYFGRDVYSASVCVFGVPIFSRNKQVLAILHDKRERERIRKSRNSRVFA